MRWVVAVDLGEMIDNDLAASMRDWLSLPDVKHLAGGHSTPLSLMSIDMLFGFSPAV